MVDTGPKLRTIVRDYIDRGEYFTINRPRQYGKTTTLFLLERALADECLVLRLSFEGRDDYFDSLAHFANSVRQDIAYAVAPEDQALADIWDAAREDESPTNYLRSRISAFCAASGKPVVLMIDEVDMATNFQVFNAFLGMLRDMYISRETGSADTFQSVILAGVTDIKNLKRKIRPEEHSGVNSPWNIAAEFTVDMSFAAGEIAGMLRAYEADHATGMDADAVAERIYFYSDGYPFLVSKLCKMIDEGSLDWTARGVDEAEKRLLGEDNTLFDDLIKNIQGYPELGRMLERMLLEGSKPPFDRGDLPISIGLMYGILKEDERDLRIANVIFETKITNYFISVFSRKEPVRGVSTESSLFIKNGRLNMDTVMSRFAHFMSTEYRDRDSGFIETNARLLFLSFLKPIINGAGHYAVEPETRGDRRMDIRVFFGGEEQIVELKLWRGEAYEQEGIAQLAEYLGILGHAKGWLLSFCDLKKTPREGGVYEVDGRTIAETVVAFKDNP
jgi:hypothetical protein